jgi:hypothetical protein
MTTPVDTSVKFGPGTLKIGATGSEIDVSCYVNGFRITATPDRGDSRTMLCGTVRPGAVKYTYEATGNLDLDLESGAAGIFALSQEQAGTTQEFEFVPNTADGTKAVGQLSIDPMDFGADEFGVPLQSDVTWQVIGEPTYTYSGGVALTGVTAGSPGSFQPVGATIPANLAALKADPVVGDTGSNKPSTAWTAGQFVNLGTGTAHWDGAAWLTGSAP